MTTNHYQLLVADPAWSFNDRLEMASIPRGAAANYSTMSVADIAALPVSQIADPDGALLALWVPSSLLAEGLQVMNAYGFQQKQTYVWVKCKTPKSLTEEVKKAFNVMLDEDYKTQVAYLKGLVKEKKEAFLALGDYVLSFGMGRLFRQTHELCLIGINNKGIYKQLANKSQRSVSFSENLKHSAKPEHLQDALETMFPNSAGKRIELFARRQRPGWTCLGNEIDGKDIRDALQELL
jgi:N6-adenosine-specific RNA methylase IME4